MLGQARTGRHYLYDAISHISTIIHCSFIAFFIAFKVKSFETKMSALTFIREIKHNNSNSSYIVSNSILH